MLSCTALCPLTTQKEDDDSGEDVTASVMAASGLDTHAASSGLTSAAAVDEPAAGLGSQTSVVDSTMAQADSDAVLAAALRLERLAAAAIESVRLVAEKAVKAHPVHTMPGTPSAYNAGHTEHTADAEDNIQTRVLAAKQASRRIRSTSPVNNIKVMSANGQEEFMLSWPAVQHGLGTGKIINILGVGFFFKKSI